MISDNIPEQLYSYSRAGSICFILILSYCVFGVARNLYFHPLSHVPGPFLAKISTLPSFYHACKGDRHLWIEHNFKKYGHKIRIYPNGVVYNDPNSYAQIYSFKANVRRSDFYKAFQRNKQSVNTFNATDNAVHTKKRHLLNLVFTDRAVRSAGTFINQHVDRWHEVLLTGGYENDGWTTPKDISRWVDRLVFDILGDLCFGRSFEIKEPGENNLKAVPHALDDHARFMYRTARSPFLNAYIWLNHHGLSTLTFYLTPVAIREYFGFVTQSVLTRLAQEKELEKSREAGKEVRTDMFHFLAQAKDPDTNELLYSHNELFAEAHLLIAAGSDTTATALSGFFFYITQDDRVYTKLTDEIRSTFSSADEITSGPELYGCHYLKACLDETIRLTPSGPSELSRTILPGGMEIDGDYLPEGITVGHSNWCTGRSEYHVDAAVYRPERWIADEKAGVTEEMVANTRAATPGFSSGRFSCVGKNLAILEMLTVMARTLYALDVRRAPGTTVGQGGPGKGWGREDATQYQLADAFISTVEGPMLQFRKRT